MINAADVRRGGRRSEASCQRLHRSAGACWRTDARRVPRLAVEADLSSKITVTPM
jgi:hypothetical protein